MLYAQLFPTVEGLGVAFFFLLVTLFWWRKSTTAAPHAEDPSEEEDDEEVTCTDSDSEGCPWPGFRDIWAAQQFAQQEDRDAAHLQQAAYIAHAAEVREREEREHVRDLDSLRALGRSRYEAHGDYESRTNEARTYKTRACEARADDC